MWKLFTIENATLLPQTVTNQSIFPDATKLQMFFSDAEIGLSLQAFFLVTWDVRSTQAQSTSFIKVERELHMNYPSLDF